MKKLFTLCFVALMSVALFAAERVVWTGNEPISWNPEVYAGSQFETPAGTFTGLEKDHVIKVSVVAGIDEPQYVMTYKAGESWEWTDLTTTVADGVMSYTVETDQIATEIADRGLIFRGQGYNITQISVVEADPDEPQPLQPGEQRVLWEGSETLAWNEVAEQSAEVGALLAENDQLIVTVSQKGTADWPKVLLRDAASNAVGDDILLNDISEFPYDAVFTLTAAHAAALAGGFKVCGDGVTVTKLVLKKYKEPDDPIDPEQPGEPYVDTQVWSGDVAISWNQEVYAGTELDTYNVQQDMFAGLAEGDSIKVYYTNAIEAAQFNLTYKAGNDWAWTELAPIAQGEDFFGYKVASEAIAQDIADRGLVIRGQGYHAVRIVVGKPENTGSAVSNTVTAAPARKIIEAGQVFILKDGVRYNILGAVVR